MPKHFRHIIFFSVRAEYTPKGITTSCNNLDTIIMSYVQIFSTSTSISLSHSLSAKIVVR